MDRMNDNPLARPFSTENHPADAELPYAELTGRIIQACYEVSNELGSGFLEQVYEKALVIALREKGIQAAAQIPLAVYFRGEIVGQYFADLYVEERIIVELKAVSALLPEHQAQLINYLKATDIEIGLLVNFGRPKVEVRRLSNKFLRRGD